jgi:hypothetical protein
MNSPWVPLVLAGHLAVLSSISFGGFPTVLPDVRAFVVAGHGWMTDQEFTNFFALAQAIPGPNMILMMGFVGWKAWGIPGAIVSAFATFGPPCVMYLIAYRLWDRFRAAPWQRIVRNGLVGDRRPCYRERHGDGARGRSRASVRRGHRHRSLADDPNASEPVFDSYRGRRCRGS